MNGIELSRAYYQQFGEPMLKRDFPALYPRLAAAKVGEGSDCFGFDDALSRDHDFEAGFLLLAPDDTDRKTLFALERAYAALPQEFMGVRRPKMAPPGGRRCGVFTVSEFYLRETGHPTPPADDAAFYAIPDYALAAATNGAVFYDGTGDFTARREGFSRLPSAVRATRLAAALIAAGQSGQYNYARCVGHGEEGAAQLAITDFVKSCLQICFLLEEKHPPFYKWVFRALRALPRFSDLAEPLSFLLTSENSAALVPHKAGIVEDVALRFSDALRKEGLSNVESPDLERHAYAVKDTVPKESPLSRLSVFG